MNVKPRMSPTPLMPSISAMVLLLDQASVAIQILEVLLGLEDQQHRLDVGGADLVGDPLHVLRAERMIEVAGHHLLVGQAGAGGLGLPEEALERLAAVLVVAVDDAHPVPAEVAHDAGHRFGLVLVTGNGADHHRVAQLVAQVRRRRSAAQLRKKELCVTYQRHHVHIEQFGHGHGHLGVEGPQDDLDPRPVVGVVAHDVERAVDLEQVAHALHRLAGGGARRTRSSRAFTVRWLGSRMPSTTSPGARAPHAGWRKSQACTRSVMRTTRAQKEKKEEKEEKKLLSGGPRFGILKGQETTTSTTAAPLLWRSTVLSCGLFL
ncbi:hypothetical protein EYF80_050211 [Liparis tanakae]|uniref:Uncharacterized protein n=1 Tax=Liparis tanakae TaxID=230148 RepID=A0A4Z2FGW9_9TELE|nr:hypothetical protein EYF80_050211 [Liparis tanakae]